MKLMMKALKSIFGVVDNHLDADGVIKGLGQSKSLSGVMDNAYDQYKIERLEERLESWVGEEVQLNTKFDAVDTASRLLADYSPQEHMGSVAEKGMGAISGLFDAIFE